MTLHIFLVMLLVCSIFTALTVEALKKMFSGGKSTKANIIAAIVAVAIAVMVGLVYAVWFTVVINIQYVVAIVVLCFLSWLCAMVGYDKVVQAITQITNKSD